MNDEEVSKRVLPNIFANAAFLIVNVVTGLLLVPFFIDELGIATYGIIPLATSVTSYVIMISGALNASVSRFMGVTFQNGDEKQTNRTYNTALFGLGYVAVAMIPVAIVIAVLSPFLFDIGSVLSLDVQILFACILTSMLISAWGTNFQTVFFVSNRLDLQNVIKITQLLLQTGFIVILFMAFGPSLPLVGAAYLIGAVVSTIVGYVLCRIFRPSLRIRRRSFDREHFKEIGGVSVWSLFSNIGNLLIIQMSMILSNILLGPAQSGMFNIVMMMILVLASFGVTISSVFTPLMYRSFSEGRRNDMVSVCRSAIKVVGILMAMPLAFLCVFSPEILTVWVGEDFIELSKIIWIAFPLFACIEAMEPLIPIGLVHLKVKIPGLMTFFFGIVNVILILIFVEYLEWGLRGLALAWLLSMVGKNCVFFPLYYSKVEGVSPVTFLVPMGHCILCFIVGAAMCFIVSELFTMPASLIILAVTAVALYAVYLFIISLVLLNKNEKKLVRSCLPGFISSRLPKWLL